MGHRLERLGRMRPRRSGSRWSGRWVFVLNRRPDVKDSASAILQAVGIDPSSQCFEYSAVGDDGSRIREFLCQEIGLTKC
jgi:hypothetical protein